MFRTFLLFTFKCAAAAFLSLFVVAVSAHSVRSQDEPVSPTNQAIELFNQGQDEHAKGNYAKAVDLYQQATKLLPEFAEAEYQKGNAYLSLGKQPDAEAAFRRAMEIRPDWTLAL